MRSTVARSWPLVALCLASALAPAALVSPALASPAPAAGTRAPAELRLRYLGVAGWELRDGQHTVLIDPYYSRPAKNGPDDLLQPDAAAIAAHAPAHASYILVEQSHFDHLLDVPAVALRTGATVIGTVSTANLARAAGVPGEQIITVRGGEDLQLDGLSVRVIPCLHSLLEHKHWFDDRVIPAGVKLPLHTAEYFSGGTLCFLVRMGGHQVLSVGSANFIERELEGLRPDVLLASGGLREEVYDYTARLLRVLGHPRWLLPSHWDDLSTPWGSPQDESAARLEPFFAEVRKASPRTKIKLLAHHGDEWTVP
jgi:L-ascorbate metabolism protein UlaG (beta-lactamase superfamily)